MFSLIMNLVFFIFYTIKLIESHDLIKLIFFCWDHHLNVTETIYKTMQRPDVEELEFVVKKLNSDVSNLLQFKISRQDTRAAELIEDVRSQVSKARRTCLYTPIN